MEGVSTVMPMALNVGSSILNGVLAARGQGGDSGASELAEARASAVEGQAKRQAEAEQRRAREQAEDMREDQQHRRARARVGAAASGLSLSGTSLLNLESLEHGQGKDLGRLLGDSSRRVADILSSGAGQAQSIRLSGQRSRAAEDGLGSLLRLGSQVFKAAGQVGHPTTVPAEPRVTAGTDWLDY